MFNVFFNLESAVLAADGQRRKRMLNKQFFKKKKLPEKIVKWDIFVQEKNKALWWIFRKGIQKEFLRFCQAINSHRMRLQKIVANHEKRERWTGETLIETSKTLYCWHRYLR